MKKPECKSKKFTRHAIQKMFQRNVTKSEIDNVISKGQIIEEYSKDSPLPSFLLLGFNDNRPLHIVIALINQILFVLLLRFMNLIQGFGEIIIQGELKNEMPVM